MPRHPSRIPWPWKVMAGECPMPPVRIGPTGITPLHRWWDDGQQSLWTHYIRKSLLGLYKTYFLWDVQGKKQEESLGLGLWLGMRMRRKKQIRGHSWAKWAGYYAFLMCLIKAVCFILLSHISNSSSVLFVWICMVIDMPATAVDTSHSPRSDSGRCTWRQPSLALSQL